ncbi:MAG: 1-deoxy-D-xylulose-5-phosphate synthase, partial [Clostridia bacterium]
MSILKKVNYPMDIKKLDINQLQELASDIRKLIISSVIQNGGHLSANLGVVELTIALHYVFDIPKDKLIFDVGHQCYTHKILTGRKNDFDKLRKKDGISGFPKTQESIFDCANSGHASTSLAISNGIATAQDVSTSKVITLLGDGALTGGLCMEAFNNFERCDTNNRIIILNDNDMAISKNVGFVDKFLKQIKFSGDTSFFDAFGIEYYGIVDGHDFNKLIKALTYAKTSKKSIFVHIATKKGKGYEVAEKNPMTYHGYPSTKFNPISFSSIVGQKLVELAENNKNIVAVTAAMEDGTGLTEFAKKFPTRFYDVGIAEGYAATFCAGLSLGGKKPYFAVYSTFLQRAYDGIIHDICLNNIPAVICLDRSGFVAYDGETHQGIYDISFLRCLPKINIICPKDQKEMQNALEFSINFDAPLVIRYPKGYINYEYEKMLQTEKFQ